MGQTGKPEQPSQSRKSIHCSRIRSFPGASMPAHAVVPPSWFPLQYVTEMSSSFSEAPICECLMCRGHFSFNECAPLIFHIVVDRVRKIETVKIVAADDPDRWRLSIINETVPRLRHMLAGRAFHINIVSKFPISTYRGTTIRTLIAKFSCYYDRVSSGLPQIELYHVFAILTDSKFFECPQQKLCHRLLFSG